MPWFSVVVDATALADPQAVVRRLEPGGAPPSGCAITRLRAVFICRG